MTRVEWVCGCTFTQKMEHSSSSYAIPDDSQEWSGVILDDQQVSGHTVNLSYVR